jgi:hypothetical protein
MNSEQTAKRWMTFLLGRSEYPGKNRLAAAFNRGHVGRICDCGCNSFDVEYSGSESVLPISTPGTRGAVFQISFRDAHTSGELEIRVSSDTQGRFDGLDVEFKGNSHPVPDILELVDPPEYVHASESLLTDDAHAATNQDSQ